MAKEDKSGEIPKLGKLEEISDLRKVWPHEAADFTPWLAEEENINLLSEALGLEIAVTEAESSVGNFSVDIYASEMGRDRKIIIENQLEETDHDHLGKLITYAAGKSADLIIWIVRHARAEHRVAIEWLNNHTKENIGFFLCEIKLYRIGNSNPAVKFEVLEQPSKDKLTSPQRRNYDYWSAFLEYAWKDDQFARQFKRKRKPSILYYMRFRIGASNCYIEPYLIWDECSVGVDLCIDDDPDKVLYNTFLEKKKQIISESGIKPLRWSERPNARYSYIATWEELDPADKGKWPEQFAWLTNTMLKMKQTFEKYL